MNLDSFQKYWNGKKIDFDRYAGVQCADGVRQWIEDIHGWNIKSAWFRPYKGNGRYGDDGVLDGYYSWKDGYQSVVDKNEGVDRNGKKYKIINIDRLEDVKAGDVVFTTGSNEWGHTGIFIVHNKLPGKFQLFDTNGNNPKRPAFWWSNYNNSTFKGAMRKVLIDDKPKPEKPKPPKPTPTPPPAPKPPKPKPKPQKTYTVKPGDSLWRIAQRELGNGNRWTEIYNLNKKVIGNNPSLIRPGQKLILP